MDTCTQREGKGNSIQLFQLRQINVTPDISTEEERLSKRTGKLCTDRQTDRGREEDRHTENMFLEGQREEEGGERQRQTQTDRDRQTDRQTEGGRETHREYVLRGLECGRE